MAHYTSKVCKQLPATFHAIALCAHALMRSWCYAATGVLLGVRSEPTECAECGAHTWELLEATAQSARLIAITAAGGLQSFGS